MSFAGHPSEADWIEPGLLPPGQDVRVGNEIPGGFPRYLRLFHTVYADGDARLTWREAAGLQNATFHPLASFASISRGHDGREIGGHPFEGTIEYAQLRRLLRVLRSQGGSNACYFAYWRGLGGDLGDLLTVITGAATWPAAVEEAASFRIRGEDYVLLAGPLDAVLPPEEAATRYGLDLPGLSPQMWWAQDRSWIVATGIDFDSSFIGGNNRLAGALLADRSLEITEMGWRDVIPG
jgi:hypothetical protein